MDALRHILKFKKKFSLLDMAKSTGIEGLIDFCKLIEGLD